MRKSMREDGMDADVVLLAGGAEAYQDAARSFFLRAELCCPKNPWHLMRGLLVLRLIDRRS